MTTTPTVFSLLDREGNIANIRAQEDTSTGEIALQSVPELGGLPISITNPMPTLRAASVGTGMYGPLTVTNTAQFLVAAGSATKRLHIINRSAVDTVTIAFGVPAVAGAAGTMEFPPKWAETWLDGIPQDEISFISSGVSTPMTIGVG